MGFDARQFLEVASVGWTENRRQGNRSVQVVLPLLAAGLATMVAHERTSPSTISDFSDLSMIVSLTPEPTVIKYAGSFLSAVARNCAKGASAGDVFFFLQTILGYLNNAPALAGGKIKSQKVFNDIKIAAAFALCDDSCGAAHLEWAMNMEQMINRNVDATVIETPARTTARPSDQYRWEEGISEWTKRTPKALASRLVSPLAAVNKESNVSMSQAASDMNQTEHVLANISRKRETEAAIDNTGQTKVRRVRMLLAANSALEEKQPTIDSRDKSEASPPHPQTSNTFQKVDPGNDSDTDELSMPDGLLHESTRSRERPRLQPRGLKSQRLIVSMTRRVQPAKGVKISSEGVPGWIKKRIPLGIKQEAGGAEDELGSQ